MKPRPTPFLDAVQAYANLAAEQGLERCMRLSAVAIAAIKREADATGLQLHAVDVINRRTDRPLRVLGVVIHEVT